MGGWTRSCRMTPTMHALVVRGIRAVRDFPIVGSRSLSHWLVLKLDVDGRLGHIPD